MAKIKKAKPPRRGSKTARRSRKPARKAAVKRHGRKPSGKSKASKIRKLKRLARS